MELTPSGVKQANNTSLLETRNKCRNNAINNKDSIAPSISFLGESVPKRRRENSIEATNSTIPISTIPIAKQYLTIVRILLAPQKPIAPVQVPLI